MQNGNTKAVLNKRICEILDIKPTYVCFNVPCLNFEGQTGICNITEERCNPSCCSCNYSPDMESKNWKEAKEVYPDIIKPETFLRIQNEIINLDVYDECEDGSKRSIGQYQCQKNIHTNSIDIMFTNKYTETQSVTGKDFTEAYLKYLVQLLEMYCTMNKDSDSKKREGVGTLLKETLRGVLLKEEGTNRRRR